MEKPLLNNPAELPTDAVLKPVLGSANVAYIELLRRLAEMDLEPIWNYYKDGGAWLCKVQFKKKTVFWLSIWENCFRIGFYFTEKTMPGLAELDIEPALVQQLANAVPIGKLIPLGFIIQTTAELDDLITVATYKKNLK